MATRGKPGERLLVGIVPQRSDLELLLEQHWYRVPVDTAPKRGWPPRWFAAFEPKHVHGSAQAIRHFGRVAAIEEVTASDLFPGLPPGRRTGRAYYRLQLEELQELEQPIVAARPRRNPFIPTTWGKFRRATSFNDLFDDSALEDSLWGGLRQMGIENAVERQWEVQTRSRRYYLDFAVFCHDSNIDIEADGDRFHLKEAAVKYDKARDRAVAELGWTVIRFTPEELSSIDQCLETIAATVASRGGLQSSGIVPRFVPTRPTGSQGRLL